MTITYPLDLLANFPGTSVRFDLDRVEEVDPTRGGRLISKDLGPPMWGATYQTRELSPLQLRFWKARLAALEGGQNTFQGYDLTACYPMAYPRGSWPTGDAFDGIALLNDVDDTKTIRLGGLPVGYVVSVGDYLAFDYGAGDARALHQVVETAAAAGTGITPPFEVRPHLRTGYALGSDVALVRPHTNMALIPGSVSTSSSLSGRGSVSFSARQTL